MTGTPEELSMTMPAPQARRRHGAFMSLVALSLTASLGGCVTPTSQLVNELGGRLGGPAGVAKSSERVRYIVLDLPASGGAEAKLTPGTRLVWNGTLLRVEADGRIAVPERLLATASGYELVIEGRGRARLKAEQLQGDRLSVPEAAIQALTEEAARAAFRSADASAAARALGPEGVSGAAGTGGAVAGAPMYQLPTAEQLRLAPMKLTDQAALSASGHLGALAGLGTETGGVVTFGTGGLSLAQLLLAPGAATYNTRTGDTTFQAADGYAAPLPLGAGSRSSLEQSLYGTSASGRGVIVGAGGGTLVSGSGGSGGATTGGALIGSDAGSLTSPGDTGLIGADAGSLVRQPGAGLLGPDAGSLAGQPGSNLIRLDGGSLIGPDGGSLIADRGAGLIGPDGGSLIGLDGGSLIADRGAGLIADRGAGLIGLDGGTLVNTGAAAMTGYPYFPSAGLGPAKLQLLTVGLPVAPFERMTSGGVREVLLPEQTRVRAIDLQGKPLTDWTRTGATGAFELALPPTVPVVFFVVAESRVPGTAVQRATALAFAPGARERPLVVPIDSASTLVTSSLAFLVDYVPREIERLEALLATLPRDGAGYALLSGDERDDDDDDDDDREDGSAQPPTTRQVADKRLSTLRQARDSFNVLYYGVDTRAAEFQLGPEAAMTLSMASSLEAAYAELRNLVKAKQFAPKSFKPVAPQSPPELSP
jgi:hypothetical protein